MQEVGGGYRSHMDITEQVRFPRVCGRELDVVGEDNSGRFPTLTGRPPGERQGWDTAVWRSSLQRLVPVPHVKSVLLFLGLI